MTDKLLKITSYLTLITAYICIGVVSYWLIYPYEPTDYIHWETEKNTILNEGKIIKKGNKIVWEVDLEVKRPVTVSTDRFIQSNDPACSFTFLGSTVMKLEPAKRNYINNNYLVPVDFLNCKYFIRLTSRIQVNPIKTIEFNRDTEEFTVVD